MSGRSRAAGLAIIALLAIAFYAPTLRYGFVYDDEEQILANPVLRRPGSALHAFTDDVWAFQGGRTNAYRPLQVIAYAVLYQAGGASALPFHALNVVAHAGCAVLVALLAGRLGASPVAAGAAGLLFALHPAHAEPVAWIAALPDLLATLFALLAATAFLASGPLAGAGALAATAAALLSKEVAVVTPLLLAACARSAGPQRGAGRARPEGSAGSLDDPGAGRALARRLAPPVALVALFLVARRLAIGGLAPLSRWRLDAGDTALALLARVGDDARRLLVPAGFSAFTPFDAPRSAADPRVLLGAAALLATGVAAGRALRARSALLPALAWLVLPLLPSLYLPGLGDVVTADRYLTMPTVGFALVFARLLDSSRLRGPRAAGLAVLLALAYGAGTLASLPLWRESRALYAAVLARSPDARAIRLRRGLDRMRAGDAAGARADFEEVVRRHPDFADGWLNLGVLERRAGRDVEARAAFGRARDLYADEGSRRGTADALTNLAESERAAGNAARAESLLVEAIRLDPDHAAAHSNLGALYATAFGRPDLALRELEAGVRAARWYPAVRENLASLYAAAGRWQDAARVLAEAADLDPRSAPIRLRLAYALDRLGRVEEARAAYAEALRLDPSNAAAAARLEELAPR